MGVQTEVLDKVPNKEDERMDIDSSGSPAIANEKVLPAVVKEGGHTATGEAGNTGHQWLKEAEEGEQMQPGQLSESQMKELDDLISRGVVNLGLIDHSWVDKMRSQGRVVRNDGADICSRRFHDEDLQHGLVSGPVQGWLWDRWEA